MNAWNGPRASNLLCRVVTAILMLVGSTWTVARGEDADAIRRLSFLAGSWHCVIQGDRVPKGDTERVSYEFATDWSWMIERSELLENGHLHWGAQLWGYDSRQKKLVAYQFSAAGVFTKTVNGWKGDSFESTRDYDGATVIMRPLSQNAFEWVIESANGSNLITERCTR